MSVAAGVAALLQGITVQVSPFFHPIPVGSDVYRSIPVLGFRIPAGFPSPADDYLEGRIDLNEHLILHKEATFILRVKGWSMIKAGIHDGDELIVDRAVEPVDGKIVVAIVDGQMTVKRLYKKRGVVKLVAENPDFAAIEFNDGHELTIWGVVTRVLHKV